MEFRTIVPLPSTAPVISPMSRVLVLGSCFAEHIGSRLQDALATDEEGKCCVNPFGVLYNPASIAQALRLLYGEEAESLRVVDASIFEGRDGLWHSWLYSTHFSGETREECRSRCRSSLTAARRIAAVADLIIITFGTSRYYRLDDGTIVANCHKELPSTFTEHEMTAAEIAEMWLPLIEDLRQRALSLQMVFTVSPYRYRKYGYHESQLAKARLLLAVETLQATSPLLPSPSSLIHYFPAYEILLDELRDYRFYAPDMLHPSEQAVEYIWQRFTEWCFLPTTKACYQQRKKELKHHNHHANH